MHEALTNEHAGSTTGYLVIPSHPREFLIPSAPPAEWSFRAIDEVVVWEFLIEPDPHRRGERPPWLVIDEQQGPFGVERLAVPRLIPSCEWVNPAAADQWHESAWRGEAVPIPACEAAIDARDAEPFHRGRRANESPILRVRLAVVIDCDLRQRSPSAIACERKLAPLDEENARRNVYRDRQEGRSVAARLGGLPWAAFPNGRLPERWWQAEEFAAALGQWHWHASQLAYREKWERPVHTLSPAQEVVYNLLRLSDGQCPRPETLAVARARLVADARASDARSVDQWVARLESAARPGCVDPHGLLHHFPVLREAWASRRAER